MRQFVVCLLFISTLFSQDILFTGIDTYRCKIMAIDSTHIALIQEGQDRITLALVKTIESITLESGEIILQNHQISISTDHQIWHDSAAYLVGMKQIPESIDPIFGDMPKKSDLAVQQLQARIQKNNPPWGKMGGVLIGISGGLGLYLLHAEYDGPEPTFDLTTGEITYPGELREYEDRIKTFSNMQYVALGAGGVMIAISIDF